MSLLLHEPTTSSLLAVTYQIPASLKPYSGNARTHSKKQLRQIADSIQVFGFTNPILVDQGNTIIAGHGRVEAAKMLGMEQVPIIRIEHLTDEEKRAYIIADNKLAENAGWDRSILAIELQHLAEMDLGFDLTITGFDMPEIDIMLTDEDEADADDDISVSPKVTITQPGDLWHLGEHRIYCGNSLEAESYQVLMGHEQAHLIFTDPPYNVPIQGHVSGLGKTQHAEFAMASGEMTASQFTQFLESAFQQLTAHSANGSLHFICMDWRHMGEMMTAGTRCFTEFKNLCVWNKDRGGMGALYRSKHELVFLFKNGKDPHINNIELGKHGRYRTNVWDYPAVNTMRSGPENELAMHPTVKPVKMIAEAIKDCSHHGQLVLDPFGGSGSTLVAAEKTGRIARLIELEPKYVDTTIARWERLTGKKAERVLCGLKGTA